MMKNVLRDKVAEYTSAIDLFSSPCHVLLGLSGGADSMALLHALTHWETPLQVSAIHINHGLRGAAADADEAFVREYCAQCSIPLTVVHADVMAVAEEYGFTIEEAGRQVRYEAFEATRCAVNADYVLTAHTADDQAETLLMHLVRGCGVDGLAGIPAKRGNIRRPLLCCTRAEIEEYCAVNDISFLTDETNADTQYTRNYVRHRVLPLLRELNPSVGEALLRLSKCAKEDSDYLNDMAQSALRMAVCDGGYSAKTIAAQPPVIRRRMLRLMLREVSLSTIAEAHILAAEEVVLCQNGVISLCDGYLFSVEQGVVTVRKEINDNAPEPMAIDTVPVVVPWGRYICTLIEDTADATNVHKLFLQTAVDYDKIVGRLCLRCRRMGDYLHPCGRGVGKSLKKLMNEWRIPAHLRDVYPLLCDDKGVVLVPGFACDERVKATENTKHYLVCELSEVQG